MAKQEYVGSISNETGLRGVLELREANENPGDTPVDWPALPPDVLEAGETDAKWSCVCAKKGAPIAGRIRYRFGSDDDPVFLLLEFSFAAGQATGTVQREPDGAPVDQGAKVNHSERASCKFKLTADLVPSSV